MDLVLMVLVAALPMATCLQPAIITPLQPQGVKFEIPDESFNLVGLHFSVNKPLAGVAAGDVNVDLTTKTGDKWVHEDRSVAVKPGDVINYWYTSIGARGGENLEGQSWTYRVATTPAPTPAPTPARTTAAPVVTTQAPPRTSHGIQPAGEGNHGNPATQQPLHGVALNTGGTSNTGGTNTGTSNTAGRQGQGPKNVVCTSYPCLVFEDEFDTLDLKVWEHELTMSGGGNWEFQYYTNNRSNSYVRGGVLHIKPTLTADHIGEQELFKKLSVWGRGPHSTCTSNMFWGCEREGVPGLRVVNPIQSASLRSSRGFNFRYGRVEVEAKMPKGDWLWPAIWMLPTWEVYGQWPVSGEIDIVESRGNINYHDDKGQSAGVDSFGSTLHFGPDWNQDPYEKAHKEVHAQSGTFADAFHKFGCEWTEDYISFSLDGQEYLKVDPGKGGFWELGEFQKMNAFDNPWRNASKIAPFDQEFHIILNVAVGGQGFFPDTYVNTPHPKPWHDGETSFQFWRAKDQWYPTWNPTQNNGEDAALKINYVKVWKLKP